MDSLDETLEEHEEDMAEAKRNRDMSKTIGPDSEAGDDVESPGDAGAWPDTEGAGEEAAGAPSGNGSAGMSDEELMDVLDDLQTEITVVGCGGAGCNTINRMKETGITGAHMVSVNTDVRDLVQNEADEKHLLGDENRVDRGRGAGSVPQNGEEAALESISEIRGAVRGSDMVFVTAGMGGGTGTGAAPIVAKAAQEAGALTISVVTMPFTSEGEVRRANAKAGVERLRDASDTLIVVPNDRLLDSAGNLPVKQAFKIADEVLMRSVKGITELITHPSLVNLDFADVRTVMENAGVALIGIGDGEGEYRKKDAINSALRSPLLDVDISEADAVLVNVTGGEDMSIEEAEGVVEDLYDRVDPGARIIWGASVDESMGDEMRVMMAVTGVKSPQMYSKDTEYEPFQDANPNQPVHEPTNQPQTEDGTVIPEAEGSDPTPEADELEDDLGDIDYVE